MHNTLVALAKPNVGDTTIAGATRQQMRRAIKQAPVISMAINGSKQTKEAYVKPIYR